MIDFKNYERLTVKNVGSYTLIKDDYSTFDCLRRLAELEDKIENGTLVELGYHIRKSYKNHDDQRYKIILIDEVEIDKIGYDGLTKAKAEARLKELNNSYKETGEF